MKNKLFALLVCLCLLCLTACGGTEGDEVYVPNQQGTISLESVTASAGDTVTVELNGSEGLGLSAADLVIAFDFTALTYVSYDKASFFDLGTAALAEDNAGQLNICLVTLNPAEKACSFGTITFTVAKDAPAGEYPLTLSYTSCCDYNTEPLTPVVISGNVTVA